MSPSNKDAADLLRRIRDIDKIPPQAIAPAGGTRTTPNATGYVKPYDFGAAQKATEESADLLGKIAEGGMTAFQGVLNVITGLGRGVTNAAAGALPHINNTWDLYKDGFQAEDILKTTEQGLGAARSGALGFLKGVAVSGVPAAREALEKIDGKPILNWGDELLTSDDFNKLITNARKFTKDTNIFGPIEKANLAGVGEGPKKTLDDLAKLNDPKYAEEIVFPGFDVFGVKVLQMNRAQLYGLGWDILTDPTTYATMGIVGATKGLSRGVSSVAKYQKAGKPANFAEVTEKALPRPFYTDVKGAKQIPFKAPTYTVMNTSPIAYIFKEMGRGFVEAHRVRLNKVASRSSALAARQAFREEFGGTLISKFLAQPNVQLTDQYIEEIVSPLREDAVFRQRQSLVEQGIQDPMEIERIVAETSKVLDEEVKNIVANGQVFASALTGKEAADNIRRIAEENGITPLEAGMMEIADIGARELRKTTPAVAPTKKPRFNTEQASIFGRNLENASDPKNATGNFGQMWADFVATNSQATIKEVWDSLIRPIGYREANQAAIKQATAESLSETQDYIRALYGLDLSPVGKKSRKPEMDMKLVVQPIKGTKLSRLLTVSRKSGEYKHIARQTRVARDIRQGAGSKLTAKNKVIVAREEDIVNAPINFLVNLTKNYYDEVLNREGDAMKWDNLPIESKAQYAEQVIANPDLITADIFNKSFGNATIMAARVNYLVERALVTETKQFSKIRQLLDEEYNPLTVQVGHPKLYNLAFDSSEKSAAKPIYLSEIIRLSRVAAGHIQDPLVNKILFKLNVNRATLQTPNGLLDKAKIEEILFEAHAATMAKARTDYLAKLKVQQTGENSAENLVDPALLEADMEALLGQYIKDLQIKGRIATEEDILTAIEKIGDFKTEQIAALETLGKMGFDPIGAGAPAFKILTTFQSIKKTKAASTETKTFQEIRKVIAKPADKATRGTAVDVFNRIVPQLEEIAARPNTSPLIKSAISEILDGKVGIRNAVAGKATGKTFDAYFSLMGNILKQAEDKIKSGTVVGYDKVFSRAGGEYDRQAITVFLEQAYRASKSQDSLDGGYFAEQLDRLVAKMSPEKPLAEQTTAESRKTLSALNWNGEGISAGLLQTIIRFTEKQPEKVKTRELSELEIADMDRLEQALYDDLIEGLTEQEKLQFQVAMREQNIAIGETGTGRMNAVILENLDNEELALYKKMKSNAVLTVDPNGNVMELLSKMESAIKNVQNRGLLKIYFPPKIWRNGEWITVKSVSEIRPGDQFQYNEFTWLSFELQKLYKTKDPAILQLWQASKSISQRGIGNTEKAIARAIERRRASLKAQELFPSFAQRVNMAKSAAKIADPMKAGVNWRARAWLATLTIAGDKGIRAIENADPVLSKLRMRVSKDATRLVEEKKEFTKILRDLSLKFAKEGQKPSGAKVEDMSIEEVIALKNGQDFLKKVASMRVLTDEEREAWAKAMQHMLNGLELVGKNRRYDNFAQLVDAYKNPKTTDLQVPTDREVLEVLLKIEGPVGEKAKELLAKPQVKRGTVMTLLRRLSGEIKQSELDAVKDANFMKRINAAGSQQITEVADTLPDPKTLQQEMLNQITLERIALRDEGLEWIELIVADAMGAQQKQFVLERIQTHKEAGIDAMGRPYSADAPTPTYPRKGMKYTYEKETLYTGYKRIVSALSKMAKEKGLPVGSPEYQAFMTTNFMRAVRLRDMHLHVLGIFPANTPSVKAGENIIRQMGVFTPEEVQGISKPVYLTDADILDAFPPSIIGNMLFVGRAQSLPVTALAPAASFLVSAMDLIKPGTYFDEQQLNLVARVMVDLMRNNTKKVAKPNVKGGISHYALNVEAYEQLFKDVAAWMIQPETATKLWEQHIMNAAFATKIYKYKSGRVTKPILEGLIKMFDSPMASAGNKIQAMLDASDEIRKLTGREDISPEVALQADLDLNAVLAAYVDRDSLNIAQEALKIEQAVKSPEGQAILASQRKAAKGDPIKRINQIRLENDKSREELFNNLAQVRIANELKKAPEVAKDDPFDVYEDHLTARVQIKATLKWAERFGRLFYNFGMQNLRDIYGRIERGRVNDVSFFEHAAADMKAKWSAAFPDRNILGEAWKIIQQVPDEILDTSIAARMQIEAIANQTKGTGVKTLTPEQYDDLFTESRKLDEYLSLEDKDLNNAVSELWSLGGRLFSGGEKSEIRISGISPQWLNRNLREVGGGNVRAAIDENGLYTKLTDGYGFVSSKTMSDMWREWEIINPVEMIVTMHQALRRANVIPAIADSAVQLFGVPKANYKNAAAAKADGLVEIKTMEKLVRNRELVYFMDTENHYFPIQIAQELKTFSDFISEPKYINGKEGVTEKILTKSAEITNFSKVMMTILRPGNYVQNALGSIWINSYNGVLSPMAYGRAFKAMQSAGRGVKDIDINGIENKMAQYEALRAKQGFTIKSSNDPRKSDTMVITVKGKAYAFSYSDLEALGNKYGVRIPVAQNRDADLIGEFKAASTMGEAKTAIQKIARTYNKATYWIGRLHAHRDEFFRFALWLDYLSKYSWNSLEDGAREAAKIVDRAHPQVQDLSAPLQKTRQFLLFQTWKTKMTATILTDLLDKPGPIVNTIRTIEASNNSIQESSSSDTPFNLSPQGVFLPERYQFNLDPIAVNTLTGEMYKYSLANPVTDLYGSSGLLSAINFNDYQPIPDQITSILFGDNSLTDRYFAQSIPFIMDAGINYLFGRTTSGKDIGKGGVTSADYPDLFKDFMVGTGLNPIHSLLTLAFPALATGRMATMTPENRQDEVLRVLGNFLTGLKIEQLDTLKNRQTGVQELLTKLRELKGIK
jgi:hypothetical protein